MKRSLRGAGSIRQRNGQWRGQYWKVGANGRHHCEITLGPVTTTNLTQARAALRSVIESESRLKPGPITVSEFIRKVWWPVACARWRYSSIGTNESLIKCQILCNGLAETVLSDITLETLQRHVNSRGAAGMSYSTIQRTVWLLKDMLDFAAESNYIPRDPSRRLRIPQEQRVMEILRRHGESYFLEQRVRGRRPFLSVEEMRKLCSLFEGRDRLIVALSCCLALRPSETFGLSPGDYDGGDICISRRIYRGHLGEEGELKTAGSEAALPVPRALREMIEEWLAKERPCCFLFENKRRHLPIDHGEWQKRKLTPVSGVVVGFGARSVHFQMLRRFWVSNAPAFGIDLPEREATLRHMTSRAGISVSIYQQKLRPRLLEGLDRMSDAILKGLPPEAASWIPVEQ